MKTRKVAEIFIVEDEPMMQNLLNLIIERSGHHVAGIAANAEDAMEALKDIEPDIITMDLRLPGMSGLEAMEMILKDHPERKIIVITGNENAVHGPAIEAGACSVLSKPFERDELIRAIEENLE